MVNIRFFRINLWSITGYEPTLAAELAMSLEDNRLDIFQKICDDTKISIGIGAPIKSENGIYISLVIFQPNQARQLYSKKFLHPDEEAFFINGENDTVDLPNNIALAICYELCIPEHSLNAFKNGAKIYIASVAKSMSGYEKSSDILSSIAGKYSMIVLMANAVGYCDNFECAGRTSVWDNQGILKEQLDNAREGIIVIDTNTLIFEKFYIE
ncbi:MAG: carbon-nitrogen hydrolase family protein [Legionellales bacterium]|jgi:predicted amidohydrolase